jgi:thymidylate synthase (FAD)
MAQILRHRSFTFQEFSQRYAEAVDIDIVEARRQDTKNRQSSHDDLDEATKDWFKLAQKELIASAYGRYRKALSLGIAKECARHLLPLSTKTRAYMTGNIRSWIHYCQLRCGPETQLEHRKIALDIRDILCDNLPVIGTLLKELTCAETKPST